jgi:hypothetical protein
MEIGALKKDDYTVRVPFMDAEVEIRYITRDELDALHKKSKVRDWDRKHREVETLNDDKFNKALGRAAVRGWSGLTLNGEEFLYSEDNCDFLMLKWVEFAKFVGDACIDLQGLQDAEALKSVKKPSPIYGQE